MINLNKLLDKCETMTLLCTKTCTYWSMVKFGFNIQLVLTRRVMCIINNISEDVNRMKIPNIIVKVISVLIMFLNNLVKPSEKFECFERLSQQFMILSQEMEGMDQSIDREKYVILLLKYDNLIQDCAFEDIPSKYKHQVSKVYIEANRNIPIQLNGTIGNVLRRNSKDLNNNIV